jgi:hypothetical protein
MKHLLAACFVASVAIWGAGCTGSAPTTSAPTKGGEDHGHEHGEKGGEHAGHDHAAHGPHGGHLIEIGEEEYHAEWTHADDGTVTIYILDSEAKNEVPIPAEDITIETKIGENAAEFKLLAVNRSEGDMPKTAKFELVDKNLLGVLETLSKGVTATLKADINGKMYNAPITHDDHGHKH